MLMYLGLMPLRSARRLVPVLLKALAGAVATAAACTSAPSPSSIAPRRADALPTVRDSLSDSTGPAALPPVPRVEGPLHINVVYPAPNDVVEARDSSFLFGSVGNGGATLTINGQPVRVWPNGAWLAWIAFPPDSQMNF